MLRPASTKSSPVNNFCAGQRAGRDERGSAGNYHLAEVEGVA